MILWRILFISLVLTCAESMRAQLINDDCTGAVSILPGNSTEFTTNDWTPSIPPFYHGDLWFEITGNGQTIEVDICGSPGTCTVSLTRFSNSCDSIVQVVGHHEYLEECNWDWPSFQKVRFYAEVNWHYLIRIAGPIDLNALLTLNTYVVGEPLMGCNDPNACNYNQQNDWLNYFCDYANCSQECNSNENAFQLFTPLPMAISDDGTAYCDYSFTVYNINNEIALEWSDPCYQFIDNEADCTSAENLLEIGGIPYRHESHCLPNGCYTIEFENNTDYPCTAPWLLRSAGFIETISGIANSTSTFCITLNEGCLDPSALNFDPFAQLSGFCHYSGDFNQDGLFSTTDLLLLMDQFGCLAMCPEFDMNEDLIINVTDFILWLSFLSE